MTDKIEAATVLSESHQLRVVVDANVTLAMFLVRRDRPAQLSSKRILLSLLPTSNFRWLWHPDILADYERGAAALEQEPRVLKRAVFDRAGFQLLLNTLQLYPPVAVSVTTLRAARRRISQAAQARDLDLDDAIYLASAVDGAAHLLTSQDSDLLSLGGAYEEVSIVDWQGLVRELKTRGLVE